MHLRSTFAVSSPPTGTVTRPNDASRAPFDVSRSTSTEVGDGVNVAAFTIPTFPSASAAMPPTSPNPGAMVARPPVPQEATGAPVAALSR